MLLWTKFVSNTSEALQTFAARRTDERINIPHYQGVTSPSQLRYLAYIEAIVLKGTRFSAPPKRLITSIKLRSLQLNQKGNIRLSFIIESMGSIQYDHGKRHGLAKLTHRGDAAPQSEEFCFNTEDTLVVGDVCLRFFVFEDVPAGNLQHSDLGHGAKTIKYGNIIGRELCFVTFHTAFHDGTDRVTFQRSEIDGVHDKPIEDFQNEFSICVTCQTACSRQRSTRAGSRKRTSRTHIPDLPKTQAYFQPDVVADGLQKTDFKLPNSNQSNLEPAQIAYGCAPGLRLLLLWEMLTKIMNLSTVVTFKRGDIMYDTRKLPEQRALFIIISGDAEYDHFEGDEKRRPSRINRGDSIAGLPLGVGDCFGEIAFILGHEGGTGSFQIVAVSKLVEVIDVVLENDDI